MNGRLRGYKSVLSALGVFCVLAFQVTPGYAQQTLTLQDALQYAMDNSEALRKAKLDIIAGQLKVSEVRASALPQIDATSTLTNNLLVQSFVLPAEAFGGAPGEFMAIKAGQTWNALSQVQLNQQIF